MGSASSRFPSSLIKIQEQEEYKDFILVVLVDVVLSRSSGEYSLKTMRVVERVQWCNIPAAESSCHGGDV